MRKQSSLKINVALNIIKTLMGVLFPLITFSYVSRVLGPEGTGKVSYSISIISYFSIIAGLGIGTYGMREASKIRNNEFELNKFCREIFFINIISTCVAYGLLAVVLIFFKSLIEYRALLFICSSTIFFTTIGMEWLYSAMEDYLYITIRSIAFQILGIVLLFLMVRDSQDYLQYAFLSVITSVGSNFLNFIHSKKYINLLRKTPLEIKKHLKPIFILFGTVVAVSLYTVLDTTMIGYFCGDGEVGIYNAATKSTRIVIMVIAATGTVLAPRLSNYVENDKENYKTLLVKSFNVYVGFAVPCAVGLYFLARPITLLLCGIKYEASISVMKMLAPIVLFVPLGAFFSDQIFTPMRKDKFSLIPVLITAVCNIILNLILIPKYGALGAAFASVIAEIIVVIIKLILSSGLVKISLLFSNFYQYVIASMMMFLGLFGLSFVLDMEKTISIVLYPLVGAIIYFIVLLLFKNSFVIEVVLSIKNKIGEKNMQEISFVMLTWNRKLFLQKSLESFYNNFSKKFTYEFLIIDNGSNDGTVDLLKEYEKKDSNLRIIYNEKNNGLQEYVKLFSMAKGKYIIELDDDVIEYPIDFDLLMIQYKKTFHRFGMLCLDVVKNEYTNGAKPDDSCYKEKVKNEMIVQVGPCGGWCTIFSKLDYNLVQPFFRMQKLNMKNGEDGKLMFLFGKILRKKFGVIKDVKCLHACGPKYSKMFGYLDRDIEKYKSADLGGLVEMYSTER